MLSILDSSDAMLTYLRFKFKLNVSHNKIAKMQKISNYHTYFRGLHGPVKYFLQMRHLFFEEPEN